MYQVLAPCAVKAERRPASVPLRCSTLTGPAVKPRHLACLPPPPCVSLMYTVHVFHDLSNALCCSQFFYIIHIHMSSHVHTLSYTASRSPSTHIPSLTRCCPLPACPHLGMAYSTSISSCALTYGLLNVADIVYTCSVAHVMVHGMAALTTTTAQWRFSSNAPIKRLS